MEVLVFIPIVSNLFSVTINPLGDVKDIITSVWEKVEVYLKDERACSEKPVSRKLEGSMSTDLLTALVIQKFNHLNCKKTVTD